MIVVAAAFLAILVVAFTLGVHARALPPPEPVSPFRHLEQRRAVIYENLRDFFVYDERGKFTGCCALHIVWDDLAEIKALAIAQNYQHKGIGTKLVLTLHKRALTLGINRVFALTFKPKFFLNLKYTQITRESLPHKIWGECVKCPLFPDCGEVPLILELKKKN